MRSPCLCVILTFVALGSMSCAGAVTDPGPGKRVKLEISKQVYQAGDTVAIDVINESNVQLTYPSDFCPQDLQRQGGGTWTDVPLPGQSQGCAFSIAVLAPLSQETAFVLLPNDLTAGIYRILLPAPTADFTNPSLAEPPLVTSEFTVNSP